MTITQTHRTNRAAGLPQKQAVLFTSGVAYYERAAEIEHNHRMELALTRKQIQDVLKSMVLIDEGGGQIGIVNYESNDPLERTLESFRLNLGDNPDLAELLNRLRGVAVRVQVGGREIAGNIVGVESRLRRFRKYAIKEQLLKVFSDGKLQSLSLDSIQRMPVRTTR